MAEKWIRTHKRSYDRRKSVVYAHHFTRNSASGKVLENIGMRREGVLRQHVKKWGRFEDIIVYGILREDYQ
ncbi:MAG: GNAT family N-acetyltransferase [Candidatus Krumholzibacteria bacterium]|nr:GNAT family N-acetyltransferase [Candidatus Krumholzibacteria bacterium]